MTRRTVLTSGALMSRCCVVAALIAVTFSAVAAQQQMPPTLRERAAKEGHVRAGAIVDWTCCKDLAELVQHSTLVARGEVTDFKSRLSDDEREVWTDYTIDIQQIYKQTGKGNLGPGAKIQVFKLGGRLVVDGHPVEFDVSGSPPIPKGVVHMFFITVCSTAHCADPYSFVAADGAISLENERVSCTDKPHVVWRSYCGTSEDSFISAVKEKVALSIRNGSPK
jgi:hypothetical protein